MEWSSKKRGLVLQQLLEIITKLVAVFCLLFLSEAAGNIHLDCFTSHFLISQNTLSNTKTIYFQLKCQMKTLDISDN